MSRYRAKMVPGGSVAMDLLGRSSIALTMNTYSHVIPAMQREAAGQMDAILEPVASSQAKRQAAKQVM